ncbi:ovarian-specific serine/threonine-protein kinase lok-related [Anaeramoeba flamelloides]|uniref:Ovarian-specific serine/threonine-protein kinase lok-related n=1 Tax=Anaeramoeba flamelloides TaxID=1746091 RepID=A0AAV7ZDB0_9EUKA|nr:ovarian-specific serine/threonine-protein kinase lok-related [Anaeramoeba flamelloides]
MNKKTQHLTKKEFFLKYEKKELVGQGAFSNVYRIVEHKSQKEYCLKIQSCKGIEENGKNEIETLSVLNHPNVTKLYEMYKIKNKMFLVMEYAKGGSLMDLIEEKSRFTETEAAFVILILLKALKYLHSKNIIHRDLKPENILLMNSCDITSILITDFGFSKFLQENEYTKTFCGTATYMAPEILKQEEYDTSVDIWSTGVILYLLLSGLPPFFDYSIPLLHRKIMNGKLYFPKEQFSTISKRAMKLIKHFLKVNPKERITIDQALKNTWLLKKSNEFIKQKLQENKQLENGQEMNGTKEKPKLNK